MSESEKKEQRILPAAEDDYWWAEGYDHPIAVVYFAPRDGGDSRLSGLMAHDCGTYRDVADPSWRWLCRIPTPEQLAAQAAQLAAGQALADAERHKYSLRRAESPVSHGTLAWSAAYDIAQIRVEAARQALLVAFPGGAR